MGGGGTFPSEEKRDGYLGISEAPFIPSDWSYSAFYSKHIADSDQMLTYKSRFKPTDFSLARFFSFFWATFRKILATSGRGTLPEAS